MELPDEQREPDRRTPLVLVTGMRAGVDRVASALVDAGTVVVRHDLAALGEGVVRRTVTTVDGDKLTVLELAHGCVSCTLRQDLLPLLCTLAARDSVRRIVLALDPVLEADAVCHAVAETSVTGVVGRIDGPAGRDVRVQAVLSALDAETWLPDAAGDETLSERYGTPEDDRTVAQVVLAHAEFADAVVLFGAPEPLERMTLEAVFARLNPLAPIVWAGAGEIPVEMLLAAIAGDARRGAGFDPHAPLLRGNPTLEADGGVALVEFNAERPFHPQRLHEAIDVLLEGVITARGRIWLATQPEHLLWLESAGAALRVGRADTWLAAMTPEEQAEVTEAEPERMALAALRWNPRFGDRHTSLVVLVHQADPSEIERALRWAVVTDEELADESSWRFWADPFAEWHEDPCDTAESARVRNQEEGQS